jgi:hypothetical protein
MTEAVYRRYMSEYGHRLGVRGDSPGEAVRTHTIPSDRYDRGGLPPLYVGVRHRPSHSLGVRGDSPGEAVRTRTVPSILNEHLTDY